MKLFAMITAGLMALGGAAFYLHHSGSCPFSSSCPVAQSGGCCEISSESSCCEAPSRAAAMEVNDPLQICETCCTAGAEVMVSATAADVEESCPFCDSPANDAIDAVTAGASLQ